MTDRTNDPMTDETRDEIVRLARKGLDANEIALNLNVDHQDMPDLEPEQVQAVIDEADREVERMLTPSVPRTNRDDGREEWSVHVPAANDAIGRIAKWLDDARESGMDSRTMAKALSDAAGEMAADALDGRLEDTDAEWLANWLDKSASATT